LKKREKKKLNDFYLIPKESFTTSNGVASIQTPSLRLSLIPIIYYWFRIEYYCLFF